jgi:hypothetical protein
VADDIKVDFDERGGALNLLCGVEAFARLRDSVIADASLAGFADGIPDRVRYITIATRAPTRSARQRWIQDRVALLGCGLVAFAVLFVLVVGIGTIVGWFR